MYTEIGVFKAKAKFSSIIQQVRQGQCYTITLRGKPIIDLVPHRAVDEQAASATIERMRQIPKVQGISTKRLLASIKAGRK